MNLNRTGRSHFRPAGFSLMELLIVIAIIGTLAALTFVAVGQIKKSQYKSVARAEMEVIEMALENYKAKYGAYPPGNQLPGTSTYSPAMFSQVYYELSGTTNNGASFVTLDGVSTIPANSVSTAYGVGGFINCMGTGDDAVVAKNFLLNLKQKQFNTFITNNGVRTTLLITSVGGPDEVYQPLNAPGLNPFRYVYPGTNNPNSYDLWVQLVIGGKTNLICNWSRQVILNSPLP